MIVTSIAFVPSQVAAQETPSSESEGEVRERARALANNGMALYRAGKYQEAIAIFRDAERAFSAPTIRLMVARSYDKMGRLVEARDVYKTIIGEILAHYAPAEFFDAQRTARTELAALVKRIPTACVLVVGLPAADVSISVDGLPVEASKPFARNPGVYTVRVRAPGQATIGRIVELKEGSMEQIRIGLMGSSAAAEGARVAAIAAPTEGQTDGFVSDPSAVLIISAIAVNVTLTGVGVGLMAASSSQRDTAVTVFLAACVVDVGIFGYAIVDSQVRQSSTITVRARSSSSSGGIVLSGEW